MYDLTKKQTMEIDGKTFTVGYSGQDDLDDVIARAYVIVGDYALQFSMRNFDARVTDKQYNDFITIIKSIKFLKN